MMLKVVFAIWAVAPIVGASSSQRKYDGSTLSYDPKGRIFQVEYAMEATRRGGTVLGVCGVDSVALVTRDPPQPLSSCRSSRSRGVWAVDSHVGIAASGLRSDVQYVVDCARTWCSEHQFVFGGPMPCQMLSRRIADLVHSCTTRGGKRPLAVDVLVGGVDERAGPSLHRVQATGAFQRYRAVAAGGGGEAANARLAADAPRTPTQSTAEEEIHMFRQSGETPSDEVSGAVGGGGGDAVAADVEASNKKTGEDDIGVPRGRDNGSSASDEEGATRDSSSSDGNGRGDGERNSRAPTWSGSRSGRRQRQRLAGPEHRAILKRALSALWEEDLEESNGVIDGDASVRQKSEAAAAVKSSENKPGLTRGGLKASELSAAVYAVKKPGLSVGEGSKEEEEEEEEDALDGGEYRALECSTEDFETVLFELDGEKWEARKKNTARNSGDADGLRCR